MKEKVQLILAMCIYGTIGVFVRYIPLPSSIIAFARAVIGSLFVVLVFLFSKRKPDFKIIKKNGLPLLVSGICLGANWILLFESYRYTTVAIGTLCNYMAPIFIVIASSVFLGEKLNLKKCICILAAMLGMVFVSGIIEGGVPKGNQLIGVLFGLASAVLYAIIVLLNKKFKDVDGFDRTIVQLGVSAIAILPYILMTENLGSIQMDSFAIFMILFVGVVHTGIAYVLYFGSIKNLPAQTIAILSYLDPVIAIILSMLILKEPLGVFGAIGAILILGSTFVSERN